MESVLEHDDVAAPAMPARELDRALVGLGAGVADEDLAAEGDLREALRQAQLRRRVEQIADMDQRLRLACDGVDDTRMAMAELRDRDAGEEVEVLVAVRVPEARCLAADELDRIAAVGRHQVVALELL